MNKKITDLFYAPIGLVAGASQMIPVLAEQGRMQVANARLIGEMAARMGSAKLVDQVSDPSALVQGLLTRAGFTPPKVAADAKATVPASTPSPAKPAAAEPAHKPTAAQKATKVPTASELAIVDYDSLAASQVVSRLVALSAEELEAVRRYELANRARKTILGRVAQLQR